jgi:hypothetical protein
MMIVLQSFFNSNRMPDHMQIEELVNLMVPANSDIMPDTATQREYNHRITQGELIEPFVRTFEGIILRTPEDIANLPDGDHTLHLFEGLPAHRVVTIQVSDANPVIRPIREETERIVAEVEAAAALAADAAANADDDEEYLPSTLSMAAPRPLLVRQNAVSRISGAGNTARALFGAGDDDDDEVDSTASTVITSRKRRKTHKKYRSHKSKKSHKIKTKTKGKRMKTRSKRKSKGKKSRKSRK